MPHSKKNNTSKRMELMTPCYSGYRRVHDLDQGLCAESQLYKMDPELVLVSQDLGNESLTHGGVVSGNNHFSYDKAYNKNCSVQSYRKCDGVLQMNQGHHGPHGPHGPQGHHGPHGPQGHHGSQGHHGHHGPHGPQGPIVENFPGVVSSQPVNYPQNVPMRVNPIGGAGAYFQNPVPHLASSTSPDNSYPANGRSSNAVACGTRVTRLPEKRKPIKVDGNQLHKLGL